LIFILCISRVEMLRRTIASATCLHHRTSFLPSTSTQLQCVRYVHKGDRLRPAHQVLQLVGSKPLQLEEGSPSLELLERATTKPTLLNELLSRGDPLLESDYFGLANAFTMQDLFAANVHWGHKIGTLHPGMTEYLLGKRLGTCIIDLTHTVEQLRTALNFIAHISYKDGIILFVTHDRLNMLDIENAATACGEFAHTRRWTPGTFTDSRRCFGTEVRLPDIVIMTSLMYTQLKEHPVVKEAAKMCIPTVAVCDTNVDPRLITYPIAGNDDSRSCVQLYLRLFTRAIECGKKRRQEDEMRRDDAAKSQQQYAKNAPNEDLQRSGNINPQVQQRQ